MERAQADPRRERLQTQGLVRVIDEPARLSYGIRMPLEPRFIRPAALARSKPGTLCHFAARVKPHVLAARESRGAGWTTVDPGRAHGIYEESICARVTLDQR
jgi:hypothetical protein